MVDVYRVRRGEDKPDLPRACSEIRLHFIVDTGSRLAWRDDLDSQVGANGKFSRTKRAGARRRNKRCVGLSKAIRPQTVGGTWPGHVTQAFRRNETKQQMGDPGRQNAILGT